VGLELGADDYVTKPFSMRELIARVKSVLRRSATEEPVKSSEAIVSGDLRIDPARYEVSVRGKEVELSPKEFDLLRFLAAHPDQVFSRQSLLDNVWGTDSYVEDRTVDVHIRWLREKIEVDPSQPLKLTTVRGVGYKLRGAG
jgi:DNA-binding response OmpR family regulator